MITYMSLPNIDKASVDGVIRPLHQFTTVDHQCSSSSIAHNLQYIPRTTDSERGEIRTGRLMLKAAPAAQNIREISTNY